MTDPVRRVAVLDDYQGVALEFVDRSSLPSSVRVDVARTPLRGAALVEFLAGAFAVVAMRERTRFDESLLARLPDLELVITTGMVNDAIDLAAARRRGLTVCGTRSLAGPATELTWALVMAAMRRLPEELASIRAGGWQTTVGTSLEGRRLGVLGLGHIGRRVARIAKTFDMEVVAWSPHLSAKTAREAGARFLPLDDLLSTSDVVTVHLKLGERSRGLIGERELRLMRDDAWLVNTSRGPIVTETALLRAVREGWIAGAALDVFDEEPLPAEHPFRRTPGILATGHIGYVTDDNYRTYYGDAVEGIAAYLRGEPVRVLT